MQYKFISHFYIKQVSRRIFRWGKCKCLNMKGAFFTESIRLDNWLLVSRRVKMRTLTEVGDAEAAWRL